MAARRILADEVTVIVTVQDGTAITAYERSAALDPEGPGATALEMTRDIMDFYDTNQFNP